MKFPTLLVAAAALSACSTQVPEESAGTPLKPSESLDIAATAKPQPQIEPAIALTRSPNVAAEKAEVEAVEEIASASPAEEPAAANVAQEIAAAPAAEATAAEQIAAAPAAETQPEAQAVVAKAPAASDDATCNRGELEEGLSFILCEDGRLRKAGVVAALSAPHDPGLTIQEVASRYEVAPQVFTGIQSATYGSLVNGNRQAPRNRGKHKAQTGLVQIDGKIYEVYQLSVAGKNGTIFIEQSSDEE